MGLMRFDLMNCVRPVFGLDMFKPKTGSEKEVVVVSFIADNERAAKDMADFIDTGAIDGINDAQASPGSDTRGRHFVWVEIKRNAHTPVVIMKLIRDVQNIIGAEKWYFKTYPDRKIVPLSVERLANAFFQKGSDSGNFYMREPEFKDEKQEDDNS